jgi:cobalamin biosynthesis Mg chelatase CobN
MTSRDRMVLIAVIVIAVLGGAWMLLVSPARKQANELNAQVAAAQAQLVSAEGKVSSARAAQSEYASAYASVVSLGKAVPPSQEVPALIDQLTQASKAKSVDFSAISASGAATSSGAAPSSSAATSSSAAASSSAGASSGAATSAGSTASFTSLPFSFTFSGSYFDLEHLFRQLTDFANLTPSGDLQVSGRLLTINSVSLSLGGGSESGAKATGANQQLTGSINATAYVLPASQGLTGAAASTAGAASPASSTASSSSTTSPAIVRLNP